MAIQETGDLVTIRLCATRDIPAGEVIRVDLDDGRALAVYNLDGEFFATDDLCTHGDASLAEGEVDGGKIENVYRLQLMNASEQPMRVTITAEGMPELDVEGGRGESTTLELPPAANRLVPVRVRRPADDATPGSHKIHFVIQADHGNGSLVLREPSSFIVPR